MKFDYYAELISLSACPTDLKSPTGLISGCGCTTWSTRGDDEKNEARQCYRKYAKQLSTLQLPEELKLDTCLSSLPDATWIGFEIGFELQSPWYSKDDKPFHVLDNPVRKDRVFGVPYVSAASWKGLSRWACRMRSGLIGHLEGHNGRMDDWQDESWIAYLFGNEKEGKKDFQQGALVFYPTWFEKIDFEVINPHSRARRAGTQPIYYEVVPAETKGLLCLLYAPLSGAAERDKVDPDKALCNLLDATETLLTSYGISAKRTANWGTAKIESWKAFNRDQNPIEKSSLPDFKDAIQSWMTSEVKAP
ncbi:MAG: RAMP superfamily CRISPR-associated protein [Methanothrix sp.]